MNSLTENMQGPDESEMLKSFDTPLTHEPLQINPADDGLISKIQEKLSKKTEEVIKILSE